MNKRLKKKKNEETKEKAAPIPHALMEKVKLVVKENLSEGEEDDYFIREKVNVSFREDFFDGELITVKISGGKIESSVDSPNYYGNSIARDIRREVTEVEFIGFDCQYDVHLDFKIRK